MTKTALHIPTEHGELVGWRSDDARPADRRVLLLHGGPGLSYDYLDEAADDIGPGWDVATFQQRGLPPSTQDGPFDITTAVDDVRAALDALAWDRAFVMGHSWGGHLVFHVATSLSERLIGVLAVDPLGAVGDGGGEAFGAELFARTPDADVARIKELEAGEEAGTYTEADEVESLRLLWPAYFADPSSAPPFEPVRISIDANRALFAALLEALPALEASLSEIRVPVGVLMGAQSPMPLTAGSDAVARIPGAWLDVVADAGHFPWVEQPGCVRRALERLTV